ncbi:hypothetical protein X979_6010 [Burkholderia pseudomallei MSHR7527]|nr:hypothetical protein X979_6010 [Burkholderia pseudomallei MSHR7527]
MHEPHLQLGQRGGERLVGLDSRLQLQRLAFLDERAHPVHLTARERRLAHAADHLVAPRVRHEPREDRRAPGRQLVDRRHVEIRVVRHRERARDRRRRHHQLVRLEARRAVGRVRRLRPQREPLLDAEAVLLVDDHEPEPREFDGVLNHRVRADHELRGAERGRLERRALVLRLQAAGEPRDRHAERLEPAAQLARVLLGEDFGGRHQRGLVAGVDRLRGRERRDDRLAAADVALQQALHRVRLREVVRDLRDDALLRGRERKRQRRVQARGQRRAVVARAARHRGRGARAALLVRALERQLLREQLVELDARPRGVGAVDERRLVRADARMMEHAHRVGERRHVERLQIRARDLGRQQLGQRRARERIVDRLAQIRLRHARRARIDGRQRLRQRRVLVDGLHRRMHDLQPEEAAAHVAAHAQPLADRHLLDLRAVEVQEAQHELGAVVVAQLHEQLTARPVRDLVVEHDAFRLRGLARQQFAHRRERRLVLVAHRQMQDEVDVARQAELREFVGGFHGLRCRLGAGCVRCRLRGRLRDRFRGGLRRPFGRLRRAGGRRVGG